MNAFVSAMEYNPKDAELILKVARALVTTHDYAGSIEYYTKVRPTGAAPPYIAHGSDAMKTRGMAYIAQGCPEERSACVHRGRAEVCIGAELRCASGQS